MDDTNTMNIEKERAKPTLSDIGFVLDGKNKVKDFNGNIFANYIISQYDFIYSIDGS